jgi:hypothetical protein
VNIKRLQELGDRRRETQTAADVAYARALDGALEELGDRRQRHGDVTLAAKLVGVTRQTLYNEIQRRAAAAKEAPQ